MQLGTYIKTYRHRKKQLQKDLAYRAMITPQYLNDLEKNRREPSDETLKRLQEALGFNLDYAFLLIGRLPPDLRDNPSKDRMTKAYKILRGKDGRQQVSRNDKGRFISPKPTPTTTTPTETAGN